MNKIYLHNGTVIEGAIVKWNKKRLIIETSQGLLTLFRPKKEVRMVLELRREQTSFSLQPQQQPRPSSLNRSLPPIPVEFGAVLERNGEAWEVTDIIGEYVTLQNQDTGDLIYPHRIELTADIWNYLGMAESKQEQQPQQEQPQAKNKQSLFIDQMRQNLQRRNQKYIDGLK